MCVCVRGVGVESKMGKRDVCEGGKMCWGRGPWSTNTHTQ